MSGTPVGGLGLATRLRTYFYRVFKAEIFGQTLWVFGRSSPSGYPLAGWRVFRVFQRFEIALRLAISRVFRVFARDFWPSYGRFFAFLPYCTSK